MFHGNLRDPLIMVVDNPLIRPAMLFSFVGKEALGVGTLRFLVLEAENGEAKNCDML